MHSSFILRRALLLEIAIVYGDVCAVEGGAHQGKETPEEQRFWPPCSSKPVCTTQDVTEHLESCSYV